MPGISTESILDRSGLGNTLLREFAEVGVDRIGNGNELVWIYVAGINGFRQAPLTRDNALRLAKMIHDEVTRE